MRKPLKRRKNIETSGYESTTAWRYKIPKSGYTETELFNDTTYAFCNKCGWWNSGGSRHSLDYHNTREETSKLKYSARHVADTHDANPPGG